MGDVLLWDQPPAAALCRATGSQRGLRATSQAIELLPEPGTGAEGGQDTAQQVRGAAGTGEGGKKEPGKSAGRSNGAGRGTLRSSAPDEGSRSSSYLTPNPRVSLQDDGKGRGCVPCWHLGCRGGEQQRRAAAGEAQTGGKRKKKQNTSQRLNAALGFRGSEDSIKIGKTETRN